LAAVTTTHRITTLLAILIALAPAAFAATERGVMVRVAQIFIAPDPTSAKIATIDRGREVAVLEKSRDWIHVLATLAENRETEESRDVSGWMLDKGVVRAGTPDGDRILFGEAVSSEAEASRRGGRRGAAQDALRLYARTAEYFPQSPMAGEAAYRAADIVWQLEKSQLAARPSSHLRDPHDRFGIEEDAMKKIIKKYPGTKWADLAAFRLIDNKLCGDWMAESKCPEKESELYEKYVQEHPQSPVAAEALYNAAWRQAALIEIYKTEGKSGKSPEAQSKTTAIAQHIISTYPQSDWAARAQTLLYMVQQGIPTFGNALQ
jgi:outer membrane protein assembly factor BamD (BamD/ComL family)